MQLLDIFVQTWHQKSLIGELLTNSAINSKQESLSNSLCDLLMNEERPLGLMLVSQNSFVSPLKLLKINSWLKEKVKHETIDDYSFLLTQMKTPHDQALERTIKN